MGYRSQVYLKTTTEGFLVIKRFNDSIETKEHRPLYGADVNKTESGFYKISFDDVKWYDSFKEVENFMHTLDLLEEQEIPFSYVRLGEETNDIDHRCNWTDDIPDEISSFEPVVDLNDEDWIGYESVDIED